MGTEEIILIHHTDCGMQASTTASSAPSSRPRPASPSRGTPRRSRTSTLDVLKSIARIRESPFIPHSDRVRGFVYEVATGELREVPQAA